MSSQTRIYQFHKWRLFFRQGWLPTVQLFRKVWEHQHSIPLSWKRCFGEGRLHVPLARKSKWNILKDTLFALQHWSLMSCGLEKESCAASQKMRKEKWAVAFSMTTVRSSISFAVCLQQRINLLLIWTLPIQRLHISSVLERTVSLRTFL